MVTKSPFCHVTWLLVGAAVAALALQANHNLAPTTSSCPTTPNVVEARRIVLRDSKDRVRAVLECTEDGRPSLRFRDQYGETTMEIGIDVVGMSEITMYNGGTISVYGSEELDVAPFEVQVLPEFEPEMWLRSKAGHLRLATEALDLNPHCIGQPYTQPVGPRIELLSHELDGRATLYANHGGGCGLAIGVEPGNEEISWQPPVPAPSSQPTTTERHPSLRIGIDGDGKPEVQIR